MQVIIENPVRFEGVDYPVGRPVVADALGLRMVNAGVAKRAVPLPQEYPAKTYIDPATGQDVQVGQDGYPVFEATSQYQSLASTPGLIDFGISPNHERPLFPKLDAVA